MNAKLNEIASHFKFEGSIKEINSLGEGLINDTFIIETEGDDSNYILQRKNKLIFNNIPAMMQNIQTVTQHLKNKIEQQGGDPMRETLTLIETNNDALYHIDNDGEYWAACYLIPHTITHHRADNAHLAYAGGAAIGKFQHMLADMNEPLTDILPGFHNMKFRFQQWGEVLLKDPLGRKKELLKEIDWIESRREEMLSFWQKVELGILPMRVTHNDTKISNILFDNQDNELAVIDLDTVLNSTCLNDYGDAIRSYTNTGAEDDKNLDQVSVNMNIFEEYTKGYLLYASSFLTKEEGDSVAFSARYITFEQVLRFLIDYINGDNYYKIKYNNHNLVRTHAQYKLLLSIEENYNEMNDFVEMILATHGKINYRNE